MKIMEKDETAEWNIAMKNMEFWEDTYGMITGVIMLLGLIDFVISGVSCVLSVINYTTAAQWLSYAYVGLGCFIGLLLLSLPVMERRANFWEERGKTVSANSLEFLDPIYAALDAGKQMVVQTAPSRCGGLRNEFLIRSREEFDVLRGLWDWRPQTRITYSMNIRILWEGIIEFETLRMFWDDPGLKAIGCNDDNYLIPLDPVYEWLMERKGKFGIILMDIDDYEGPVAYVPMEDGEVKMGAY